MSKVSIDELRKFDEIVHRIILTSKGNAELFFNTGKKGLTTLEIAIIELVFKYPDIIIKDIIEMLHIPNSTLTNAINRLENKELIERVISKKDRRSYGLKLTSKGQYAQTQHMEYEKVLFTKILSPLSTDERMQFIASLNKIIDSLLEMR